MKSAPLSQSRYWWCHALACVALPRAYSPDVYTAEFLRLFEHVYERFA